MKIGNEEDERKQIINQFMDSVMATIEEKRNKKGSLNKLDDDDYDEIDENIIETFFSFDKEEQEYLVVYLTDMTVELMMRSALEREKAKEKQQ